MQLTATEAKRRLSELLGRGDDEPIIITRYGKPEVVMISPERLAELEAIKHYYASPSADSTGTEDS